MFDLYRHFFYSFPIIIFYLYISPLATLVISSSSFLLYFLYLIFIYIFVDYIPTGTFIIKCMERSQIKSLTSSSTSSAFLCTSSEVEVSSLVVRTVQHCGEDPDDEVRLAALDFIRAHICWSLNKAGMYLCVYVCMFPLVSFLYVENFAFIFHHCM